jgi:predicted DNA-binding transcriptional regulator YafY
MERLERFFRIDRMLRESRAVSMKLLLSRLGVSVSTLKRDLEYMRDRMDAPIEYDRELNGYRYGGEKDKGRFALPGFWLHADEIHALLMMRALLTTLGTSLLSAIVDPFTSRLEALLVEAGGQPTEIRRRIKIQSFELRRPDPNRFGVLATAVMQRKRVRIRHFNRDRNETTDRDISPQQLSFHRGKWYVDAWCHLRHDLRRFAIDALRDAQLLDSLAKEISDSEMATTFTKGYGIFGGKATSMAELKFSPHRSRWMEADLWHEDQTSMLAPDGSLTVKIPYGDDRELVRDLLRQGSDVEVIAPTSLRKRVEQEIARMTAVYSKPARRPNNRRARSSGERPHA